MLVLSRNIDQSIRIGDQVTVTIVDIKGKQARIGISAPADVQVHRQEIYELIQAELETSEQSEPDIPTDSPTES